MNAATAMQIMPVIMAYPFSLSYIKTKQGCLLAKPFIMPSVYFEQAKGAFDLFMHYDAVQL